VLKWPFFGCTTVYKIINEWSFGWFLSFRTSTRAKSGREEEEKILEIVSFINNHMITTYQEERNG